MKLNYGECEITYLFNSGFIIETKSFVLLIDYYKSDKKINFDKFNSKKIYILVSHDHSDHFNPEIFNLNNLNNPTYILDKNIDYRSSFKIIEVSEDENYVINEYFKLKTFGSTDRGVSFFISIEGLNIFHSGDLNWWKWKADSVEQQKKEEKDYKSEINKLRSFSFDIAFVPVDPRLEENYDLAVKYFAKKINAKVIIPMHFRDKVNPVEVLENSWSNLNFESNLVLIKNSGEKFLYKK